MLRFAGFELDQQRAELRGPDGGAVKLRPKTFDLLILFVGNPGRILSKQELMEAVWPNVHVGEDSLFQCIRELRAALGDDQRQIVKLVSGRGYMFDVDVAPTTPPAGAAPAPAEDSARPPAPLILPDPAAPVWAGFMKRRILAAAGVGVAAVVGFAVAAPILRPETPKRVPVVTVMPIAEADSQTSAMRSGVADRLTDGLAKIDNIHVVASSGAKPAENVSAPAESDYVVHAEMSKNQQSWTLRARLVKTATGQVESIPSITIDEKNLDPDLLQTRLAAGIGHPLAVRINALIEADSQPSEADTSPQRSAARAAIDQATASIVQTSRERFAQAQTMLEKALKNDPDNVDLEVALASMQLRGIQMAWYGPDESVTAEKSAQDLLERVLRVRPTRIPVLEAYCRFLNTTNQFVESLVACSRTLAFDPWDGMALYLIGVGQLQLGRFEDALATFKQADRYDTPQVSRWTWLLGIGWSYMTLNRYEEALPWLEKSIAITPASGRPLMLLAAAYQGAGRTEEAKAALARAIQVRPGSTASNISLPIKNSSAAFLAYSEKIRTALIQVGLPLR